MARFAETFDRLQANVVASVRGKPEAVRLALCCLLAEGHLLIEDVPGTGKTTLARAVAGSIGGTVRRLQFTPDLLPSDVTGTMVLDTTGSRLTFREGPVFANVVIGDEINRASPKTQSAMLEVMDERQVTVDGTSRPVPRPFFVIATQNPQDFQGTYPLPDVQLDRFAMRLSLGYVAADVELDLVMLDSLRRASPDVAPVVSLHDVSDMIAAVDEVHVGQAIGEYVVAIANATRAHADLRLGASTRAVLSLLRLARAAAATDARDFVTPQDVQQMASPAWAHRMALRPDAELRGLDAAVVLADVLDAVPVPRRRVEST